MYIHAECHWSCIRNNITLVTMWQFVHDLVITPLKVMLWITSTTLGEHCKHDIQGDCSLLMHAVHCMAR